MIILMIKLLLLMLPKPPIQRPKKKTKQSYSGKRKTHDQNTSNCRTRKPKYYCNKFSLEKTWLWFLFKESKPILAKIPN
ncbi:hypothetical protein [Spiroplasma poulsonii]|uniref:hypothetical protein n=1 Tax=Spiroplasma poulsonii TaxID=2138 RepID=UPI001F4CB19C|nr:hypothetical protein [Spiroplasma poulsonii]UNF62485.1 hypothetical protein MNU24_03230 [Spiroplasma poulsonii]